MADVEETTDKVTVLLIIVGVLILVYVVYKVIKGLGDSVANAFGLQGASCVVAAITNPGQVTCAQKKAIKDCLAKTFPGQKAVTDANVDWAATKISELNAQGPNTLQYAFNYWFGTNWGVPDKCLPKCSKQACTQPPPECCVYGQFPVGI